ncbi:hypothetical protein K1719_025835 [Acacia pycnantha]|nr:hypothetical protein K1719_025835 [Acacia pycnantha]
MKEKGVDGDIPYLPPEIIRNILKRLSVKSLFRFQCVSREWRNLFKNQSFIADHLEHSKHQKPCLLLQSIDDKDRLWNVYCLDSEMQFWKLQKPLLPDYYKRGKIVGSINGLLCFQINKPKVYPHFLFMWNPATRELKQVPHTIFHYKDCFLGFGFSPIINDYKIVMTYAPEYKVKLSALKVYSLISDSWKEVKFRLNYTACVRSQSVTVNGVMFWLGSKVVGEDIDDQKVIVSFDLAVEVLTLIPIPDPNPLPILIVYEEKLAIVSCIRNLEDSIIDLWVREEVVGASQERWGWTKKYISSPYRCDKWNIWRNEIVYMIDVENEPTIVFFNPTTKQIKKLAAGKCDYNHRIFNYVESLVAIGALD